MRKPSELKNAALAALSGNWSPAVLATLVLFAISVAISAFNLASEDSFSLTLIVMLLNVFIMYPLDVGFSNIWKNLYEKGDTDMTAGMFRISFSAYWRHLGAMLLMGLIILAGCILFIIPGIIFAYMYSMTPFILVEHPEMSITDALRASRMMMSGHKFDLFYLELTFIGWALLCLLTLGIGFLWLTPYMMTTVAAFYNDLKAEQQLATVES